MPVVMRDGPYRYFFYSKENNEPPHVHVARGRDEAKFWLEPNVTLARAHGLARHEINRLQHMVEQHRDELLRRWNEHFGQ